MLAKKKPNNRSFEVFTTDDTCSIAEISDFIKESSNRCKIRTKIHGAGFGCDYSMVMEDGTGEFYDVNPGAKILKSNKNEVCVLTEEQYRILFK